MKIELCVASPLGLDVAKRMSVDRIELCQNLEVGGLTPSIGFVNLALNKRLPIHVLIRPRIGGFCYSDEEFSLICEEIRAFRFLPIQGFVVGLYNESGKLDKARLKQLMELGNGKEFTFHRAIDDLENWEEAMETLIQLGFKRILTSGLSSTLDAGLHNLEKLIEKSANRIEIMAGGGVNDDNIKDLLYRIKPHAIHFSGTKTILKDDHSKFMVPRLEVDEEKCLRWGEEIKSPQGVLMTNK